MKPTGHKSPTLKVIDGDSDAKQAELRKYCGQLRSHHAHFTSDLETALQPGMLAVWKPGMKNRIRPEYGVPLIVVAVLADYTVDTEHSCGSAYYREPLNLVLGLVDEDGDFETRHYDARRFEPFVDASETVA